MKNAELSESNSNLKRYFSYTQLISICYFGDFYLKRKHYSCSQLECQMNEEFTQRLAALEKKFQQAIREKELLRKQLEVNIS